MSVETIEQSISGRMPGKYSDMFLRSLAGLTDLYVVESGPNAHGGRYRDGAIPLFHVEVAPGATPDASGFQETMDFYKGPFDEDPQPPRLLTFLELAASHDNALEYGI